jgi:outer membrane protein
MRKHTTTLIGASIAIVLVFVVAGGAFAQNAANSLKGKIAFVDMIKFQAGSKQIKARTQKMLAFRDKKRKELINLQNQIKDLQDQLQKQAIMLKEDTRKQKERKMQHLAIDLQTMEKQAKADLEREARDNQQFIGKKLQKIVADIRAQKKYALILNHVAILSADDALDITDEVIKRYDAVPETAKPAQRPARRNTGRTHPATRR